MRLVLIFVVLASLALPSCTSREAISNKAPQTSEDTADRAQREVASSSQACLNLNLATADQLIKLPGVGDVMAKRIIDYRERHGRFRRPEEIIIIEGFSERKYRAISALICV